MVSDWLSPKSPSPSENWMTSSRLPSVCSAKETNVISGWLGYAGSGIQPVQSSAKLVSIAPNERNIWIRMWKLFEGLDSKLRNPHLRGHECEEFDSTRSRESGCRLARWTQGVNSFRRGIKDEAERGVCFKVVSLSNAHSAILNGSTNSLIELIILRKIMVIDGRNRCYRLLDMENSKVMHSISIESIN